MSNVQQTKDNAENMGKVRELMEQAKQVNLGGELTNSVHIQFTTAFGTEIEGVVEFKRPTMQDYMKIGAFKAQFLGANGVVNMNLVDGTVKFMAHVMATLKVVIVKAPRWLINKNGEIDVESIIEPDILYHIYDEYEKWEYSFRREPKEDLQGDSTATE